MLHLARRSLLLVAGFLSLGCGIIGIFLPLIPTTPFLLLSAYCFSRSSTRLHHWLISHRVFGPIILDWEKYGVIRTHIKWIATVSMLVMVSYPLIFMLKAVWLKAIVATTICAVLIFIWTRPSKKALLGIEQADVGKGS